MVGELCIAGDGVARGYLNNSELTEEKFIPNLYGEGMMYRSGDLARWLPDGNIEYVGRVDEQIKLRGFRIELAEIESVLRKVHNVKEATVIIRERDSERHICAYIVGEKNLDMGTIRREIEKDLPTYMVPAFMMQIEQIPLTRNGKVNKAALPHIEVKGNYEYVAPKNEMEEMILNVFAEVLGIEKIGLEDNFYELGGDSIKAIRVVSKLREEKIEMSVRDIMMMRVMESILKKAKNTVDKVEYEQGEVVGLVPLTPIQNAFFEWHLSNENYFNQAVMLKSERELEEQVVKKVLREIVIHHDVLRAVFVNKEQKIREVDDDELFQFEVYNFMNMDEVLVKELVQEKNNKLQSSIDIEIGPLLKAALYKTIKGNYLMI
ncbi:AMP-binding protein, partial [Bacillus mobilis]